MTPTVKAPHTYTDWLRAHTWAQIMDERNAEGLQWRWERSTHMAEHGVTAGPLDAAGHITYQVQSASDPDRHYHVTIEKGCTCPDKKASFGWCKHRFAAWRYQKWLTAERR